MNYKKIYIDLVQSRKNMNRIKIVYDGFESHHILPKSLGGNDEPDNLVLLTYREHFLAHKLLIKITTGKDKSKMSYALFRMTHFNSQHNRKINSKDYEYAKEQVALNCSGTNSFFYGKSHSEETKKEISERMKNYNPQKGKKPWNYGKKLPPISTEHKLIISEANKNKPITKEFRTKMSEIHKGKPKSEDHKKKLSEANKGKTLSKEAIEKGAAKRRGKKSKLLICPHCQKEGGSGPMLRWHFDNCKNAPQ